MATTRFTTDDALTKEAWEEKRFRETEKKSFWKKFMSSDMNSICNVITELEKDRGDAITVPLLKRCKMAAITGGGQLEGREDQLTYVNDRLTLEEYRIGIRVRKLIDQQRVLMDISKDAQSQLEIRGAEIIDELIFTELFSDATLYMYSDSTSVPKSTNALATALAALHATNSKLNPALISAARAIAKTGNNRDFNPITPVALEGGQGMLVLVTHPYALYDFKQNSAYQQAIREAQDRGKDNPLFRDAVAVWDNVVIYEHEDVPTGTSGGQFYAKAKLMGAQAMLWAWGIRPKIEQEYFDYKAEVGYGYSLVAGVKKPTFESKDFGSIELTLAATDIGS